jgi:hypothetical protein
VINKAIEISMHFAFLREEGGSEADGRRMRDVTINARLLPLSLRDIPLPEGDEGIVSLSPGF